VDDVVVKTRNSNMLIADLEETFASLREYRWKLNPNKCVYGVPSGKLLNFIIIHRGIKANPENISAITSMIAPTCIKDVQKLTRVHGGCEQLHAPSISEPTPSTTDPAHPPAGQEVMMIDVDWRQPFIDYLSEKKVPSDKNLVEQLIRRAKSYVLVGYKLYRWGASSGVLMKCVPREEGKGILEKIHKGVCGNHASSRTLVSRAF
jgi:hypothetical protein